MERWSFRIGAGMIALAAVLACLTPALADGGLQVVGHQVWGNKVIASVRNTADRKLSGTVAVEVDHGGTTHRTSQRVQAAVGQTVTVSLILGTITEDINPLDSIRLGIILDDPDPIGP